MAFGASATSSVFFTTDLLASLDGDALGQVARLIHVAAARDGNVVREQLEREDGQDRLQHGDRGGHVEHRIGSRGHPGWAPAGPGGYRGPCPGALPHVAHSLPLPPRRGATRP